jgi:hypothetical protein
MKKILAIATILFSFLAANAQVYVGGALGYSTEKETKDASSVNSFTFAPEVGYNFDQHWTAGLLINYTSVSKDDVTLSGFGVGGYARYNFLNTGIVTLFVEGGAGVTAYNKDRGNNFYVSLNPGLSVALSERVSLVGKTGLLGYSKNSDKLGGGSSFGIGVDNTDISLGVYYHF